MGPLHGLPISVKEHLGMAGCTTHASYVAFIGQPQAVDVSVNNVLWEAGCVFYARTTQPQAVMQQETASNIYGITLNPFNSELTPGGSSGGESALIAMRGSVLVCTTSLDMISVFNIIRVSVAMLEALSAAQLRIQASTDSNPRPAA